MRYACLAMAMAATWATSTDPATAAEEWDVVLDGALKEGADLHLYLVVDNAAGRVLRGFGLGPRFNRMPYALLPDALDVSQGRLRGKATVTIPSDGYVPRGGETLTVAVELDAKVSGETLEGTYEAHVGVETRKGAVTGRRFPEPKADAAQRLDLACEGAVYKTKGKRRARRLGIDLDAKDGRVVAARLVPPGSITDVGMIAKAGKHDLRIEDGRLTGRLEGTVRPQNAKDQPIAYVWEIDGRVIGDRAAGRMAVTEDGQAAGEGHFLAKVRAGAPDPGDALYRLSLYGAVPPHNFMDLRLATRGGKVLHGFATTPNFNNSIHTVDLGGLALEGGRLTGEADVTIIPDAWIPRDRRPVPCTYTLDVAAAHGAAAGTFTGRFGESDAQGDVAGGLDPKPDLDRVTGLTLKLENGGFGRGFLTLKYEGGTVAGGRVWNNHSNLEGTIDAADLDWSNERIRGTVTVTVAKGGVKAGTYTCTVEGVLVGAMGAGTGTTVYAADSSRKTTSFWVALKTGE